MLAQRNQRIDQPACTLGVFGTLARINRNRLGNIAGEVVTQRSQYSWLCSPSLVTVVGRCSVVRRCRRLFSDFHAVGPSRSSSWGCFAVLIGLLSALTGCGPSEERYPEVICSPHAIRNSRICATNRFDAPATGHRRRSLAVLRSARPGLIRKLVELLLECRPAIHRCPEGLGTHSGWIRGRFSWSCLPRVASLSSLDGAPTTTRRQRQAPYAGDPPRRCTHPRRHKPAATALVRRIDIHPLLTGLGRK